MERHHHRALDERAIVSGDEEGARNMAGARAKDMLATLSMIKEKYSGADGYVKAKCGLRNEDIKSIRAHIVADRPT
ncbi:hypothetical protein MMC06_005246 [Schaereria dolodes]|nr:hypothetical protein [Schaereria dolodes]